MSGYLAAAAAAQCQRCEWSRKTFDNAHLLCPDCLVRQAPIMEAKKKEIGGDIGSDDGVSSVDSEESEVVYNDSTDDDWGSEIADEESVHSDLPELSPQMRRVYNTIVHTDEDQTELQRLLGNQSALLLRQLRRPRDVLASKRSLGR